MYGNREFIRTVLPYLNSLCSTTSTNLMPVFCCVVNQASGIEGQPPTQIKKIQDTQHMPSRSVLILTVPLHFVVIHNCIPDATLNTFQITDWKLMEDFTSMRLDS